MRMRRGALYSRSMHRSRAMETVVGPLAVACFWVVPVAPITFIYHQQMRETSRVRLRLPWTRGGNMMEGTRSRHLPVHRTRSTDPPIDACVLGPPDIAPEVDVVSLSSRTRLRHRLAQPTCSYLRRGILIERSWNWARREDIHCSFWIPYPPGSRRFSIAGSENRPT
ncbi:hypothetical protein DFH08DRAFT_842519 [Mycena albidolilacea]|uniref:Uncharacterized protein n=1 Tax=Mycena albidolilacea TaxID=1033008 RepID=A0AAD7AJU4_9AGAR|nr:hypothetical protein DFH08DRAFT_842519 [Mycena albidolilacea]